MQALSDREMVPFRHRDVLANFTPPPCMFMDFYFIQKFVDRLALPARANEEPQSSPNYRCERNGICGLQNDYGPGGKF